MAKQYQKRVVQDVTNHKNSISFAEANAIVLQPTSMLPRKLLSARWDISEVWLAVLEKRGDGPPVTILNPESPPTKHVKRYRWDAAVAWMENRGKPLLPPDPATMTPAQRTGHLQSLGSARDNSIWDPQKIGGDSALDELGRANKQIEDADENPLQVMDDPNASLPENDGAQ